VAKPDAQKAISKPRTAKTKPPQAIEKDLLS
jgi:hypothetical protein